MSKLAQNFAKYVVYARLQAKGVVERPDVIGAIFGQTEGLLGNDLDLRELQRTGRIGRIEVTVRTNKGASQADITIPSSLDAAETSLIAASMETIDKVGPCDAEISVSKVEDVRTQKRKYVIDRAKEILKLMVDQGMPDIQKIAENIRQEVCTWDVANYEGLACGPGITEADEIIIVEGRADVINLLRNGIKNVIAIEGSKIPETVVKLTREKTTTAFLDGDRGGDLDLKKLLAIADIDFVARADEGHEVEELTKKQIFKSLRERVPADQSKTENGAAKRQEAIEDVTPFKKMLDELVGTRASYLVDRNMKIMNKVPLSELSEVIGRHNNVYAIVVDGKINQSLVDFAAARNILYVVGIDYKEETRSDAVKILTAANFS